jgi:hypothetical protein
MPFPAAAIQLRGVEDAKERASHAAIQFYEEKKQGFSKNSIFKN